jgi:hypothetical protein
MADVEFLEMKNYLPMSGELINILSELNGIIW